MVVIRQHKENQKLIWLCLTTLNLFLLLIGGFAYYYNRANTTIDELNAKIEQQNKTIEQQHAAQTTLITANQSIQSQLEEALQVSVNIEEENNAELTELSNQNQQLTENIKSLTTQLDELTKLNEQYVSERALSVVELESKYRQLVADAEVKVTQLDTANTEIEQERAKVQSYYDEINSHFYINNDLKIKVMEEKTENQHYWVAEVVASKEAPLKSEFASSTYGGTRETLSTMANRTGAALAINASGFYTETNKPMGSIVRDGQLLQTDPNFTWEVLSTTWYGDLNFFQVNNQEDAYKADINDSFAFGPILVRDGAATELKDTSRHPRTAIGQLDDKRYVIVVAEGRLENAEGLTLSELQTIFLNLGCKTAYNLDGGGSTSLYFKGKLLNAPSDGKERAITDMIYF